MALEINPPPSPEEKAARAAIDRLNEAMLLRELVMKLGPGCTAVFVATYPAGDDGTEGRACVTFGQADDAEFRDLLQWGMA